MEEYASSCQNADTDDDVASSGGSVSSHACTEQREGDLSKDLLGMAGRIHSKLCVGDDRVLPVKFHQSACKVMAAMRDALLDPTVHVHKDVIMLLLYSGIDVHRRVALLDDAQERSDLRITMGLLFTLQVLCEQREHGVPSVASTAECEHTSKRHEWNNAPLESTMRSAREQGSAATRAPTLVCKSCLQDAQRLPADHGFGTLCDIADVFFHCSTMVLQQNAFDASARNDATSFLTLGTANFLMEANRDTNQRRLAALVSSAESEVGQSVLRDLILSFTLPPWLLQRRRQVLLSRAANSNASQHFMSAVNAAHEAAMRGAEWTWEQDENEVHKMCALLAGLCMIITGRGGKDSVRKNDAFHGRVQLPFLHTRAPPAGTPRLSYVDHMDTWIVYAVDNATTPTVDLKHCGFDGFCMCVLHLLKSVKPG